MGVILTLVLVLVMVVVWKRRTPATPSLMPTTQITSSPQVYPRNDVYNHTLTSTPREASASGLIEQTPTNTAREKDKISCLASQKELCVLHARDPLYELLGLGPNTPLLVEGQKVTPRMITIQIDNATYSDEQTNDATNKVLISTRKTYNSKTKTLALVIGTEPGYFSGLTFEEQRTLYVAQIVRSFLAMLSQSPDNYVKIQQITSTLGSWQPTP